MEIDLYFFQTCHNQIFVMATFVWSHYTKCNTIPISGKFL